ncbi:DUF2783 domain-containing protein [Hyphococcus sp. DH-69]|uniref:DUF2783 domain-containing protein n=1 Tax=Hyphococcus formosus TaxID=3143534 RepID=UPI00398B2140
MQTSGVVKFEPAYENADAFYAALVEAVDAVGDEAAPQFLARLALILSNQIGAEDVLHEAIRTAKEELL